MYQVCYIFAIALFKIKLDFIARKIRGLSIFSVGLSHGEKKVWSGEWEGDRRHQQSYPGNRFYY